MSRLGKGALVAGVAGVALFLSMFVSWFGAAGLEAEFAEENRELAEGSESTPVPPRTRPSRGGRRWGGSASG